MEDLLGSLHCYGRKATPGGQTTPAPAAGGKVKAVLLSKPGPAYTEAARSACISGVVKLRMVLARDGRVTCILPVSTLSHGLTASAISAARKIKFNPATVGGRPVSQWVTVEYNFECR